MKGPGAEVNDLFWTNKVQQTTRRQLYLEYAMYLTGNRSSKRKISKRQLSLIEQKVMTHRSVMKKLIGK